MKRRIPQSATNKERTSNAPSSRRKMISVEITPGAFEAMKKLSLRTGIRQKIMTGRILEWFCDLPEIEQSLVLTNFSAEDLPLLSDLLIRRRIAELVADDRIAYYSGMNVALNLLSQIGPNAIHPTSPPTPKAQA